MSEREAFLRTIRANPDDDTARLVFADWLDERDDPLGTFIRVQLELHPIRAQVDQPRVGKLLKQEEALLGSHRKEWLGKASQIGEKVRETNLVFERGLPARACLSLDTLLAEGGQLFSACPTLYEVAVFDVQNRGPELASYPLLDRIDRLEIADWATETDTTALFASPAITSRPVLRVWTGTNVSQCCLNWVPKGASLNERIELVQLPPGIDANVKKLTAKFRRAHKKSISVLRPFEVIFPLAPVPHLETGRLPDGRPALLAVQYHESWAVLFVFDEDGNQSFARRWKPPKNAAKGWAQARAKLTPGLIWVKEFHHSEGIGVSFWRGRDWQYFESPFERDPYEDEEDWRARGGNIRRWIEEGDFVVTFGDSDWDNRFTSRVPPS